MILGMYPLIIVSERLTKFLAHGKNVHAFSREEFIALAGEGERKGHLDESESRILGNLFRFKSLRAEDVMTPRPVLHAMSEMTSIEEAHEKTEKWPFSRIPLYQDSIDHITGFVLRDDVLLAAAEGRHTEPLGKLKREIMITPRMMSLSVLLERMLDRRDHIAIVVDEHGGTHGLVTLEDVVETLLGAEIVDEIDRVEDMQAYARGRWEERAKRLGITPGSGRPEEE